MSKILQTWWYTTFGGTTIGIVKTYDEITKEEKFRIGKGDGWDEEADAKHIAEEGDHFQPGEIN